MNEPVCCHALTIDVERDRKWLDSLQGWSGHITNIMQPKTGDGDSLHVAHPSHFYPPVLFMHVSNI